MAARSLNKVTLIGNLTRDPELRYTPQGTAVAQFGLATNRDWVTSGGEKKEDVQYHRIVAWSKLAELCSQLLSKGSKVYVEGRIVYRNFEGKDGTQKNITEIVVDNMIFLGGGKGGPVHTGEEHTDRKDSADEAVNMMEEEHPAPKKKAAEPAPAHDDSADKDKIDDEDIPF